jgi:hypothetical protein
VTILLTSAFLLFIAVTYFGFFRKTRQNCAPVTSCARMATDNPKAAIGLIRWVALLVLLAYITYHKEFISNNWYWTDWGFFFEEGIYLRWINELLRGKVLYKDIYFYAGPFMVWPQYWLMKFFGPSVALSRLYVYFGYFIGYIMVFKVLRQIVKSKTLILAAMSLILFLYYPLFPGFHQSLGRFAVSLLPLYFCYRFFCSKRRSYLAVTGVCLGFALLFSQELGLGSGVAVAAMMGVYIYRDRDLKDIPYHILTVMAGAMAILLPVVFYFYYHHALADFYEGMVVVPRYYSIGTWGTRFPNFLRLFGSGENPDYGAKEILLAYWPIVFYSGSVFFFLILFARRQFSDRVILLFGIAALGGIMFQRAFGLYSLVKIKDVMYPVVLLAAAFLDMAFTRVRFLASERRLAAQKVELAFCGAAFVFVVTGIIGYMQPAAFHPGSLPRKYYSLAEKVFPRYMSDLDIPRARNIAIPSQRAQEVRDAVKYVQDNTTPDEPIYVFPYLPIYYFLADRESPTKYEPIYSILKETREDVVKQLEDAGVKFVIYMDGWSLSDISANVAFPEIWEYLMNAYEVEKEFGDTKILRRKQEAAP